MKVYKAGLHNVVFKAKLNAGALTMKSILACLAAMWRAQFCKNIVRYNFVKSVSFVS